MELNKNDGEVCTDSMDAQSGGAGEIDLYDDLIAFAELPPEEQVRLADVQGKASDETNNASPEGGAVVEDSEGRPFLESEPTTATTYPVETLEAEIGIQSPEDEEELASSEAFDATAAIEAVEVETRSAEEIREHGGREPAFTHTQIEPVESETAAPAGEAADEFEVLSGPVEQKVEQEEAPPPMDSGPKPSGPLSGFNLPPNIIYTGALSQGVCVACGSDSSTDDLFCMTCGAFNDEVRLSLPANPTCSDCNKRIGPDEIFCPWCGSVLTAA